MVEQRAGAAAAATTGRLALQSVIMGAKSVSRKGLTMKIVKL